MRALVLPGGPAFHVPERMAEALSGLLQGTPGVEVSCDVVEALDVLADTSTLAGYDLIVPLWTGGDLTPAQEQGLAAAVQAGTGLGSVHGAATAFRGSASYQALIGGQFIDHPGGEVPYAVEVDRTHPITDSVPDFSVTTEQYYMHVDPANRTLAHTRFAGDFGPLSANGPVTMPVAWTRSYGSGRVFYCALGHRPEVLDAPAARRLVARGLLWAARAL